MEEDGARIAIRKKREMAPMEQTPELQNKKTVLVVDDGCTRLKRSTSRSLVSVARPAAAAGLSHGAGHEIEMRDDAVGRSFLRSFPKRGTAVPDPGRVQRALQLRFIMPTSLCG